MQHPKCCTKNLTVFKFDPTSSNMLQHITTYRNRVAKRRQHVVSNNVARCCVEMLRAFGQALTSCQPRMYADDTHITYAGVDVNSIQLNLNHDLDNLNKWLISNKLTLISAKTEFMLIGSRQKLSTLSNPLKLSIDNVAIEHVSSVKSLGIFIDENLRWQTHIDKLSKKVASGIGAIKRIRPFVPPPSLHYIYNALIQSHFDYCNPVWCNCGKTLFDRLQKLQNRAARVLTFSSYDADANRLIRQLDWKDLSTQF